MTTKVRMQLSARPPPAAASSTPAYWTAHVRRRPEAERVEDACRQEHQEKADEQGRVGDGPGQDEHLDPLFGRIKLPN
jgi:hypothetical protein